MNGLWRGLEGVRDLWVGAHSNVQCPTASLIHAVCARLRMTCYITTLPQFRITKGGVNIANFAFTVAKSGASPTASKGVSRAPAVSQPGKKPTAAESAAPVRSPLAPLPSPLASKRPAVPSAQVLAKKKVSGAWCTKLRAMSFRLSG